MMSTVRIGAPLLLLFGCAQIGQSGPVDSAPSSGIGPRQMIALGEIDVGRNQEHRFKISDLPEGERFVLGLNVTSGSCEVLLSEKSVAIRILDEHGRVVVNEDRALKDFKWSRGRDECLPAFGYLRGQARSVPIGRSGDVCNEPVYSGADYGYGTQFVARKGAVYAITVRPHGEETSTRNAPPAQVALAFDGRHEPRRCP